jgi:hypothetical protein
VRADGIHGVLVGRDGWHYDRFMVTIIRGMGLDGIGIN